MLSHTNKNNEIAQPIKIAYVFNSPFIIGGGEISFTELIRSLDRKQIKPIIFLPGHGEIEDKFKKLKNDSINIVSFPSLKSFNFMKSFSKLKHFITLIKSSGASLIHVNGSRACFYSSIAGRMLGIPVIWHVRETIKDYYIYDLFLGLLSKRIIVVSKGVKQRRFSRFGSLLENKIKVAYNGVDTERFKKSEEYRQIHRKEMDINEDIALGFIASVQPLKGQLFFLRALARVKDINPALKIKVFFIGRTLDSKYLKELAAFVKRSNLNGWVEFSGYMENMEKVYTAMDMFILTSEREGFSRSVIEAMSSGLPVIATKIDVIEEAVTENENGLLVDHGDIESLASAIITMAANQELRNNMGKNNRMKIIKNFSLDHTVNRIENIYRMIL